MPDGFVDCVVTSPPYDNMRIYNGSIKWNWCTFRQIARELYRTIKDGGVVVWVVGDETIKASETGTSFKQALFFKDIGFKIYDTMIWEKLNSMPTNHRRYGQDFEYMFIFSKGRPDVFNPINISCKTAGKPQKYAHRPHESKIWKKNGNETRKTLSSKIKGNIWEYGTGYGGSTKDKIAFSHPAIFPERLAVDHILSWSNEGELVYDPMAGSGTTIKMAIKTGRNYVGSEIVKEYCDMGNKRIKQELAQGRFSLT